ncbi:MAG: hypothetical protein MK212_12365, partial [Saprospiraceae bacterium]|nr:hypothetical protein [Saprospiraceae bacterium]
SPSSDPLRDYYGMAIAPIRDDIDDDDILDFLVAAPRAAQGGVVYAISGKDMKVIHTMKSPQSQSNIDFGASLDAIADRDGDCVDDFVISDRSGLDSDKNTYDQTRGRIHIFSGKTGELIRSISPPPSNDRVQFAAPIASARADLNQDGVSDILTTCIIEKYGRGHGDNPAKFYVFSENSALPPLEILPEGEVWFDPHSTEADPVILKATTYPTEQVYEWYWNGERILGADKPNLEIGAAGRYTVRIPMECKDALQAYTDVQAVEDPMSGGTTDIFLGRQIHVDTVIEVKNKQIEVLVWDDKQEDGDIIALNVNGKWLLKAHELTWAQKAVEIDLNRDKDNIFIMFALNQGSIPPNTAAISIRDGKKTHFFTMRSDFRGSGAIKFVYKPEE